jgi:hypothetical protein
MPRRLAPPAALALALLLHAACGSGAGTPPPDPCLGVTCSGHGTCAPTGGQPFCRCDAGFLRATATTCEAAAQPTLAGCAAFPADHLFNTPIDDLPVHPRSADYVAAIGGAGRVHLDLGTATDMAAADYYGIPWNAVAGDALTWRTARYRSPVAGYTWNARAESDCAVGAGHALASPCTAAAAPTPLFPIPAAPLVEGGLAAGSPPPDGDHHLLIVDADACRLWELYLVFPDGSGGWDIYGSASWDLGSSDLRPAGWTSADAAGLPIFPGLVRWDEVDSGYIAHALRFVVGHSQQGFVWPATHAAGTCALGSNCPPMGLRVRLKKDVDLSGFSWRMRVILRALKEYGMFVADNGGGTSFWLSGAPDSRFSNEETRSLRAIKGSDFEVVQHGPISPQ